MHCAGTLPAAAGDCLASASAGVFSSSRCCRPCCIAHKSTREVKYKFSCTFNVRSTSTSLLHLLYCWCRVLHDLGVVVGSHRPLRRSCHAALFARTCRLCAEAAAGQSGASDSTAASVPLLPLTLRTPPALICCAVRCDPGQRGCSAQHALPSCRHLRQLPVRIKGQPLYSPPHRIDPHWGEEVIIPKVEVTAVKMTRCISHCHDCCSCWC